MRTIYRKTKGAYDLSHLLQHLFSKTDFMGKTIDLDYLEGTADIAQRLNVKRSHLIHDWRRRNPEVPKPIVELTGILLWDWQDFERWARDSGRI